MEIVSKHSINCDLQVPNTKKINIYTHSSKQKFIKFTSKDIKEEEMHGESKE
jgi:hypothetical protein